MTTTIHPETSIDPTDRKLTSTFLGLNARTVARERYAVKNPEGQPIEEWPDIVKRVVAHVANAETSSDKRNEFIESMTEIMLPREFLPNTPCLVNARSEQSK